MRLSKNVDSNFLVPPGSVVGPERHPRASMVTNAILAGLLALAPTVVLAGLGASLACESRTSSACVIVHRAEDMVGETVDSILGRLPLPGLPSPDRPAYDPNSPVVG